MSELVWIHRFNANELGLGERGAFCLVPIEARKIFFPRKNFDEAPDINENINIVLLNENITCDVTYSKPPSKSEHRLSLSSFRNYIGDEDSEKLIRPGGVGCFYRKDNSLYFAIAPTGSVYDQLLKDFPSRGRYNNLVTEAIFEADTKEPPKPGRITPSQLVHLPKPFLLLAGISGTGKTRFVRYQAKETGSINDTYCLTPVRPDWHEPSDLLGYVSRLNGDAKYVTTDVLKFIAKAWRALIDEGLEFEEKVINGFGKRAVVTGDPDVLGRISPYWLCLDEMNLAPVEQYFADYLSVLETREWNWSDEGFKYQTDALLNATVINEVRGAGLREALELNDPKYDELWRIIETYGLGIPFNLIVAGTVNMDETTHGFSRKVIDRALSFDFGEFFPNDLDDFFETKNNAKLLGFPIYSQAKKDMFTSVAADTDVKKTRGFFEAINEVLKGTPFELAFRAFNELCLSVCSFSPMDDAELQAVFDDFLMCKVLPRIEGDEDKLQGLAKSEGQNILEQLNIVLAKELSDIWDSPRVDLMRKQVGSEEPIKIVCRSRKKIERMSTLLNNGFTSFWP